MTGKINCLSDLSTWIKADMRSRAVSLSVRSLLSDPVVRFTVALRANEYLLNRGFGWPVRALPYLYFRRLSIRLGFSVPLNVFSEGLAIVHYGTLVVSPNARVGKNCRIHVGVNIGGAGGLMSVAEAESMAPVIGDNCYIGPGAKIYGPIRIGNRCAIGANAVVGRSFPHGGQTLAGVPAAVVSAQGSRGLIIEGAP